MRAKILIVGGGFAGVKAALELCKNPELAVTLLSDHSHFRYYPSLYREATGGRRAGSRIRLSDILKDRNVTFVRATATKLDRQKRLIITEDGQQFGFDKLLLALGNVTNYFGIEGLAEHSFGIKSTEEAEAFRRHLHAQFIDHGCPDTHYVIVGAGPTGIELAGALPSYLQHIINKHGAKDCKINIELIEAATQLLPRSAPSIAAAVARRLQKLGVRLHVHTAVKGQTADMLMAGDQALQTRTVVWTAGVTTNPFIKNNAFQLSPRGKAVVDAHLQAEPNIYILGDNAETQYSGMAQTALYDATFVATNIRRQLKNRPPLGYTPKQPVSVIPVGPRWAAVEWGRLRFSGLLGWLVHIFVDLIAFHDLESWPHAASQWMRDMEESEADICPTCAKK